MKTKLVVRPIVGCLTHTHFWEGPCRAGYAKDMTPEAEARAAEAAFEAAKQTLLQATPEIEMLPAIDARYNETFVVSREVYAQIEEDIDRVDFFLCMNWRIPKLERYRKPVVILQNGNEGIDFAAYCRSIGLEAHVCMDVQDLNEIAHALWVRKVVANTRALVLTHGSMPTFGLQSVIRDPELIRQRYGMEIVKLPFRDIFKYMDDVTDDEAMPIAEKIFQGAMETKIRKEWFVNDIKYYLAAKRMMDAYDCNAFSTACHELCTSEIPQQRKFTPCTCHSLLKDEGYPSGCEEDLNALLAMTIMQAAGHRPAFMGNPNMETDDLLRIHHAVPALCMNGYGKRPLQTLGLHRTGLRWQVAGRLHRERRAVCHPRPFQPHGRHHQPQTWRGAQVGVRRSVLLALLLYQDERRPWLHAPVGRFWPSSGAHLRRLHQDASPDRRGDGL